MVLNAAVIMPPLQQVIFDKTLATLLAGGTVYFWEDANRTIPKAVYELTGTGPGSYTYTSLGTFLVLSGIGSFVDNSGNNVAIYLWPYTGSPNDNPPSQTIQNYYITVVSSTGVPQFDIQNWPGILANASPINTSDTTDNIISNPQFVDVLFSTAATLGSPVTITTSGTNAETPIAPDWSVITTGSGSFSVYQLPVSDNTPGIGNPPYALGITSASYSSIMLRQRIYSPRIFSGELVSGTFIVQSTNGQVYTVTMNYTPSITGTIQQICTGVTPTSGYAVIANSTPVTITNPGSGTGYVDITLVFPVGAPLLFSNVQLCGVADATEVVAFLEETPEREVDHLFHYFQPQLNFKQIPSFLTGWDFPLNPAQFSGGSTQTCLSANPSYIWDQTIMQSSVANMDVTRETSSGALSVLTTTNNDSFYVLQYLSGAQANITNISKLAVNILAYSSNFGNVTARVYLCINQSGGTIPGVSTPLGTLAANGTFTLTRSQWILMFQNPGYASSSVIPSTYDSSVLEDVGFSGWDAKANLDTNTNNLFAIVVTFACPTSGTRVNINSIACVPGYIPTRPAPQSASEVLRECQYYYEVSDPDNNGVYFPMNSFYNGSNSTFSFATPFELNYQQTKRIAPTVAITSIAGTAANVTFILNYLNTSLAYTTTSPADEPLSSFWATPVVGTTRLYYLPNTKNPFTSVGSATNSSSYCNSANIYFNYILDARLGVV